MKESYYAQVHHDDINRLFIIFSCYSRNLLTVIKFFNITHVLTPQKLQATYLYNRATRILDSHVHAQYIYICIYSTCKIHVCMVHINLHMNPYTTNSCSTETHVYKLNIFFEIIVSGVAALLFPLNA